MAIKIIFISVFALVFGSFLNVLIYRLPRKMSIVSPPSHCTNCNKRIKWYDNIPLLSYIFLGGKCRHCKAKISPVYIIVEILNTLLWLVVYLIFGLNAHSIIIMLTVSIFVTITFIDAKHQIIPDSLNISLTILGIVATVISVFYPTVSNILGDFSLLWWERLVGGMGGGLLFMAIYYLFLAVSKKEALGGGDIKFISAVGLLLGYKLTLLCIGFSAIFACIYLFAKLLLKNNLNSPFAFGPFLTCGAFTALTVGNYLINLYLSLF